MTKTASFGAACLLASALLTGCASEKAGDETAAAPFIDAGEPADLGKDMIGAKPGPAPAVQPVPVDASCPDDGPRFPISGKCVGRTVPLMDMAGLISEAADGCEWTTKELGLPFGDAIIYRSLDCGDRSATLEFAGGAQTASLTIATSALGALEGDELVRIFGDGESDPTTRILFTLNAIPADERAGCAVRPANQEGWASDALVLAPPVEVVRAAPMDGPNTYCGPYGLDEGSTAYWRLLADYAFWFQLGQDMPEFDPASFVFIRAEQPAP